MADHLLAVDGGNTKTVALLVQTDGTLCGVGRAGCADIYGASSFDAAIAEIGSAAREAADGGSLAAVTCAVFSLAGADWPEDFTDLEEALRPLVPNASLVVVNDAIGALRAGLGSEHGVALALGTGGCVGAAGPAGRWHSSWWGLNLGAWWFGRKALDAVYAAELGLGRPTALTVVALETYAEPTVADLLHSFTRRDGRGPWETARLAAGVLAAARADGVARDIVHDHATDAAGLVRVAAARVGLGDGFPVALLGGVFRGPESDLLVADLRERLPGCNLQRAAAEPVVGALREAFENVGVAWPGARLEAALRGHELLATAGTT